MKQVTVDLSKTDWKLLRKQKDYLANWCEYIRTGLTESFVEHPELLDGVLSWIDDIQDQAAEKVGERKVFGRLK